MHDMSVLRRYGLLAEPALGSTKQAIWLSQGGARDAALAVGTGE